METTRYQKPKLTAKNKNMNKKHIALLAGLIITTNSSNLIGMKFFKKLFRKKRRSNRLLPDNPSQDILPTIIKTKIVPQKTDVNQRLISTSYDGTREIWNTQAWKCVSTLKGNAKMTGRSLGATHSPNGKLFSACSYDGRIRIWQPKTTWVLLKILNFKGHSISFSSAFSPNSKLFASVSFDGVIKIWNTKTWKLLQTIVDSTDKFFFTVKIIFDPCNPNILISVRRDFVTYIKNTSHIKIWNIITGKCLKTLIIRGRFKSFVLNPHQPSIIALAPIKHYNNEIIILDIKESKILQVLKGHISTPSVVAFSPIDRNIVASAGDTSIIVENMGLEIKIWNTKTGQCLQTFIVNGNFISAMAFSTTNRDIIAFQSKPKEIEIYNWKTDKPLKTLKGPECRIYSLEFTPNDQQDEDLEERAQFVQTFAAHSNTGTEIVGKRGKKLVLPTALLHCKFTGLLHKHF